MAANTKKTAEKRLPLSTGESIWMAIGVFLLYFSFGIGAIVLIALAVRLYYRYRGGRRQSGQYGETVVGPAISALFEEAVYEPDGGFSRETILGLGILHPGSRYQSRHRISGRYHDVAFEAAAVTVAYQKNFFGSTPFSPLFEGLFLAFDWSGEDCGVIRVIPADYPNALPQTIDPAGAGKTKQPEALRLYPVLLSQDEFTERFRLYAQEPDCAAELFSGQLCGRVLSYAQRAGAPVLLCIQKGKLFVGLDLKRQLPLDRPAFEGDLEAQRSAVKDSLRVVTDCINLLVAPEQQPE
jgi:hypothetical protein